MWQRPAAPAVTVLGSHYGMVKVRCSPAGEDAWGANTFSPECWPWAHVLAHRSVYQQA